MGIWGVARLAVIAGACALSGCVTAQNSLSQVDIESLKLTGVAVSFAPEASIQWEDGYRAYAVAKTIPDHELSDAANTPEARTYVRNLLGLKIKDRIEKKMAGQFNGSRPVRLEVVVQNFAISSAIQRVVIGGGYGMAADANLVDAKTGKVILSYPKMSATLIAGNGWGGAAVQAVIDASIEQTPAERVADRYGDNYRDWLRKS